MKAYNRFPYLVFISLFIIFSGIIALYADITEQSGIYSSQKDPAGAIKTAVERSDNNCKRIILVFGADWCPWCNRMAKFFKENEKVAALLSQNYIEIKVDLGKWDKNLDLVAKYGVDRKAGLPSIVILDRNGNRLLFKETGSLEEGKGYLEDKMVKFLGENVQPPGKSCRQ